MAESRSFHLSDNTGSETTRLWWHQTNTNTPIHKRHTHTHLTDRWTNTLQWLQLHHHRTPAHFSLMYKEMECHTCVYSKECVFLHRHRIDWCDIGMDYCLNVKPSLVLAKLVWMFYYTSLKRAWRQWMNFSRHLCADLYWSYFVSTSMKYFYCPTFHLSRTHSLLQSSL